MKIRNGFVSNSSSSSFICEICGHEECGMDMSIGEAVMYSCENGHVFCEKHAINIGTDKEMCIELIKSAIEDTKESMIKYPKYDYKTTLIKRELLLEELEKDIEVDYDDIMEDYNFASSLPSKYCPLCQLKEISNDILVKYLMVKYNIDENDIKKEIKDKFGDYNNLIKYLKNEN